jgi:hypothetical protein
MTERRRTRTRGLRASTLAAGALAAAAALLAFAGSGSAASADVPSNTTPPSISGTAQEGHQLSADHGDWTHSPTDYDYQWQRCNSSGGGCSNVSGATGSKYTLGSADVGNRVRVGVTASNADGDSGISYSGTTGVVAAAATKPSNTSPPTISGTPQDNQTLTASPGSWSGSTPITYTYQWRRCDSNGNGCSNLATGQTYEATSKDVGHRLRVVVTAKNDAGSSSATSSATEVVTAAGVGPKNTAVPTISGTAQDNQTLTAGAGSWTGNAPIAFAYQWQRCDADGNRCQAVGGATGSTYRATSTDVGHRLRVAVTAKNAFGSSTATSGATAVVVAAGPAGAIRLSNGTTSIPISSVSLPDRLILDRVSFTPPRIRSRGEQLVARFRVVDSDGYVVRDALVYAVGVPANRVTVPAETRTDQTGWATLSYTPLEGLPMKDGAQLTIFVRARKQGENPLGGVSTRRLVSIRVRPS